MKPACLPRKSLNRAGAGTGIHGEMEKYSLTEGDKGPWLTRILGSA